ncbi:MULTISPECIES: MarR family transcriptional regulator [unclassified Leifsonia]|uniref:MarR family winged helix-turn-helix transcriptional regulator n=1 Tax=unclassified Leifsonia TaxID=2663824 RepID=UPI000A1933EC|nr:MULTISPECIES: MarR family transcriptional regulator [unclassified Leifsonia]QIZ99732.1 MarR family transcriptional regulator [Leifsonia sp. PS1209]
MSPIRQRPDPRKLSDEEIELFNAFYVMRRGFDRTLDAQLQRDHGISISELEVLMALVRAPGRRLRVRELVDVTGWEKSRVSHQVTRMAARGFVERQECAEDRRASYIHLTGDGRRVLVRALPEHTATIRRVLFDVLSDDQQAEFLEIAKNMIAANEAETAVCEREDAAESEPADERVRSDVTS